MAEIVVDESRVPIVVVTFPDIISVTQLRALFVRYDLLSRRHPRIGYIIDFSRFNPVLAPAELRRAAGDFFREHREVLRRSTVCEARVVPKLLVRTGLVAFDAIAPQKWPVIHVATMQEATAWVADHLARANVPGAGLQK